MSISSKTFSSAIKSLRSAVNISPNNFDGEPSFEADNHRLNKRAAAAVVFVVGVTVAAWKIESARNGEGDYEN